MKQEPMRFALYQVTVAYVLYTTEDTEYSGEFNFNMQAINYASSSQTLVCTRMHWTRGLVRAHTAGPPYRVSDSVGLRKRL